MKRLLMLFLLGAATTAGAHSASDAYLTLSADEGGKTRGVALHGQWDIALRDLDFVLQLDDDGNGRVTWGELRRHQGEIARYAYARLRFSDASGVPCLLRPAQQRVDAHADGTYAVLDFDVVCDRPARAPTSSLFMDYSLFFTIDPSHRGIFVMHHGDDTATAVLSPANARVELTVSPQR